MSTLAPFRLCCGRRHWGPDCFDGKVVCVFCSGRFRLADLHTYSGDPDPSNVCSTCGARDEARRG